jgi:hypothetical protein
MLKKKRCSEFNGKDKLSWLSSKRDKQSKKKLMFIKPFIRKMKRSKEKKRSNSEKKKKQTEL